VVELNPAAVKESRAQQLLARLKSDARDLGAMAELMVGGAGRQPALRTDALATQAAWVAHRRRKVTARVALANQVVGELDLVFPGLDDCFKDLRARTWLPDPPPGEVAYVSVLPPGRPPVLGLSSRASSSRPQRGPFLNAAEKGLLTNSTVARGLPGPRSGP
jgi:hypothetical protein